MPRKYYLINFHARESIALFDIILIKLYSIILLLLRLCWRSDSGDVFNSVVDINNTWQRLCPSLSFSVLR